jgi:hypothetical protein
MNITVTLTENPRRNAPGKLADTELHFASGALDGLKCTGSSVWKRCGDNGRSVSFPARQYSTDGERRTFAWLRPIADVRAQERISDLVLQAYAKHEQTTVNAE